MNDKEIVNAYKSGLSTYKVAKTFNISQTQVRRILVRNEIQGRSTKTANEIELAIIERYKNNESSEKIAKDYKMNGTTVCRILKRNGIKIRPGKENKRKLDLEINWFKNIDTEVKAYYLGFLYADGNVSKRENSFKIELHKKDIGILYYNRTFDQYINEWWLPTVKNIYTLLKPNAKFVLNMNDHIFYKMYCAQDYFILNGKLDNPCGINDKFYILNRK